MKICALIPIYMSENSRSINLENLRKLKETEFKYLDAVVVCDQNFQKDDYIEGFKYIGPYGKLKNGLADARNKLFEWFYNSDYDYALLMDAREKITASGMNSFASLCDAIHKNKVNLDFIQPTLGVMISQERMEDKQRADYNNLCRLCFFKSRQAIGLHHIFIANYKKKYNKEFYIDVDKVKCSGNINDNEIFEDQYFTELLSKHFNKYMLPDICVTLGNHSASLWAPTEGESARNTNWKEVSNELFKDIKCIKEIPVKYIYIDRVEDYKDKLTAYKPRKKD